MDNKQLSITAENALAAYNNADDNGKRLLENLFGKRTFLTDVTNRIKTFEDACQELGDENPLVSQYNGLVGYFESVSDELCFTEEMHDIVAYLKLRIITAALNEGWIPLFTENEYRYYPWFILYTKDEFENLVEDEKSRCRVVGRSSGNAVAFGGVGFAYASNASSRSGTSYGSRLAFKSRELAEYCGKQFIDIWSDYIIS